jgi:hypothetical protein
MNGQQRRRNPLAPWWVGFAIIMAVVIYVGYQFTCTDCGAPAISQILVLGIIPIVYLALMYLTFTSQARDEKRNREYDPR